MTRVARAISALREHVLGCALAAAGVYWVSDALLHAADDNLGLVAHLVSTEAHRFMPRLFTVILIVGIGLALRSASVRRRSEQVETELAERIRLAELSSKIGVILAEETSLPGMLQRCAQSIVTDLDALFTRIWLHNPREELLVLHASAGRYTNLDGPHARIPVGQMKIGGIAASRTAHLTNQVVGDPLISDQEWARREGVVAFAGNPLVVGSRLVGVLGTFSRRPFPPATAGWLATIAGEIALGVQRKQSENRLQAASVTDELTGLFNRRGFFTLAGKQVEIAQRGGRAFGLVYLDVDRFKEINDRWGHQAGDRALQDVADILRESFRKSDVIGRIGGDEFVVFLSEAAAPPHRSVVLAKLRDRIAAHNSGAGRPFPLELSVGVAVAEPGRPRRLSDLLLEADREMYRAKKLGRARPRTSGKPARTRESRLTSRIPVENVAAELVPGGAAIVADLSLGGVGVGSALPLQVGGSHVIRFRFPGAADPGPALRAAVIWSDRNRSRGGDGTGFHAGLRFLDVDATTQGALAQMIAGHC